MEEDRMQPLLSICVPTCNRADIIEKMLDSIFSQGVDHRLFEVCITDNSGTDETKDVIAKKFLHIDNLYYKKTTCKGFLNSIEALKFGNGLFLKLHNDYSIFKPGALQHLITFVEKHQIGHPEIFFSMGELKNKDEIAIFDNFDSFMENVGYWTTWSSGFSIWRSDLETLLDNGIDINYMYPHTSLFYQLYDKKVYIVNDYAYVSNISPKKKGGYNLIDNFVRIYLTMVKEGLLKPGHISQKTYNKIENDIIRFCAGWYCNVKHNRNQYTFTFDKRNQIIWKTCGYFKVVKFNVCYLSLECKRAWNKIKELLKNKIEKSI